MIRLLDLRYATVVAAFGVMLLSSPAPSHAEESEGARPDYNRTGFYLGAGLAYATDLYEDEIEDQLNTGFDVNIDDTFGVDVRGGLRFLRFLAVELQYEWLDEYDIKIDNAGGKSKVKTQTVTANLKAYLPIQRFQPYLLGGIGFQRYEIDSNYFNGTFRFKEDEYKLAGRLGLGFDVYLTEHIVFFGEGSAVLSEAKINIPFVGSVDKLFYAGFQGGLLWRF